jgi:MoaA/NifB/PqqE/SkfB family radical SAM enzyme
VKLTENCQARCISCDYWKTHWKDGIDTDRAIALVNEIDELGIRSLRFTGGEPLIRKDFFAILKRSRADHFKRIVIQTNGLLLKRFHEQVNDSPITNVNVSLDGMRDSNDRIRGIQGYFDMALEGIRALRRKQIAFSVTLNGISSKELGELAEVAHGVGAHIEFNILSRSLFFLKNADIDSLWPDRSNVTAIERFVREILKRPSYEVDYIQKYYSNATLDEPPCVLGYLQVFVLSNGDVLTGCYPLPAVGNILKTSLREILESEAYRRQAEAMVRRECPSCTCGIESSLAMKNAVSSAFFELGRLVLRSADVRHPTHSQGSLGETG